MNYYNTDIQFKYELLERKIFRLTLVLSQDMDAEPCKNYELKDMARTFRGGIGY